MRQPNLGLFAAVLTFCCLSCRRARMVEWPCRDLVSRLFVRHIIIALLTILVAGTTPAAADLSDGVPEPWLSRLSPWERTCERTRDWLAERARLTAGSAQLPEAGFYISTLYFDGHRTAALVKFRAAPEVALRLGPNDEICGWKIAEIKRDAEHATDGFVVLKSHDGGTRVDLWEHLPLLLPEQKPWRMEYSQWKHHQDQFDAVIYRALHRIAVVHMPDGQSDDLRPLSDPPPPDLTAAPPSRPDDSPEVLMLRGRLQVQLRSRLIEGLPLPGLDFYVSRIDGRAKLATFRFSSVPGAWATASQGDKVCGWLVSHVSAGQADADATVEVRPWFTDRSVDLWQRLPIPEVGEMATIDATTWARHQFEPDVERLRAEGRIVVVPDSEKASTQPGD